MGTERSHHAVMVPAPTPGHMDPMLKLAKLLHANHGFHITFFVTDHVHHRLSISSPSFPPHLEGFHLEVVSDGLPPTGRVGKKYLRDLAVALGTTFVSNVRRRLSELREDPHFPEVTCFVSGLIGPVVELAEEMGVPGVLFWTTSACGFMSTLYMDELIGRGYVPLKDESYYTNGYLDTIIDWIPGLRPLSLQDTTSFVRTTDSDDVHVNFHLEAAKWASRASAVVLNTFDALERDALHAMKQKLRCIYPIGPLSALPIGEPKTPLASLHLNLWREDDRCLRWLDKHKPNTVLYISFGSISVVESRKLAEFAWGIAGSKLPFLWVVRPDIVAAGGAAEMPEGFAEEVEGRGYVCEWCPQEEVLAHPSVGGFVTHGGWNSMLEGIRWGVPMICWLSAFADQPTNCRYACDEWGVAAEVRAVERGKVEELTRAVVGGEVGRKLRERCLEWKEMANDAVSLGSKNFEGLAKLLQGDDG